MQINGQNVNQPPYTAGCTCCNCKSVSQAAPAQIQTPPAAVSNPQNPAIAQQNINSQPPYQIPPNASGVHIQIYNPCVTPPGAQAPTYNVNAPCYPSNYYTEQMGTKQNSGTGSQNGTGATNQTGGTNGTNGTNGANGVNNNGSGGENSTSTTTNSTSTTNSEAGKKTEKKEVMMLTDEYIKSLENYLNSQQKEIRINAAKQVYDRLKEDTSRKDDKALTALVNKMLQDPSNEVRMLALAALDGRICSGDQLTVSLLQNMQKSSDGYGQDAIDASNILLKMTSKPVEKEVPVDPNKKVETKKTETKTETKTESK